MKATKNGAILTINYEIEDGPKQPGDPSRLKQVYFQVERLSLKYRNGEIQQAHLRGPNVLPNGEIGRLFHDRTLLASEFPGWLIEFINAEEAHTEDRVIGEIKHNIAPVIGWLRMDAKRGIPDDDGTRLGEWRSSADKAGKVIAAMMRGK